MNRMNRMKDLAGKSGAQSRGWGGGGLVCSFPFMLRKTILQFPGVHLVPYRENGNAESTLRACACAREVLGLGGALSRSQYLLTRGKGVVDMCGRDGSVSGVNVPNSQSDE